MRRRPRPDEKKFAAFRALDARRTAAGVSLEQLVGAAGVGLRGYIYARRGIKAPRLSTMRLLEAALERLIDQADAERKLALSLLSLWQATVSLVSIDMGLSPSRVLAADPHANLKGDDFWLQAAEARHTAIYLLVTQHNVTMTDAGAVAGISKQAVSKAMRRVEDRRDNPVRDRELTLLASGLGG
ncbi:hypothetical protein [Ancylobacter oerskovii]|uniref:HTH cro/C1-type domain-containing protein n=2 Tax=Ancylobacter oerskovii TaxID=459519 RepID=A0ABW4YRQ3_9HYPH